MPVYATHYTALITKSTQCSISLNAVHLWTSLALVSNVQYVHRPICIR